MKHSYRLAMVLIAATAQAWGVWAQEKPHDDAGETSVNGGRPQNVAPTPRTRERLGQESLMDGMNTTRSPQPAKRDEHGAPKVTPPAGQGTDNAGGLPASERRPPGRHGGADDTSR